MLIVCPSCASRYSIDDDKIGVAGRKVRCASCRTDFQVSLADDRSAEFAVAAAPEPAPPPEPMTAPVAPPASTAAVAAKPAPAPPPPTKRSADDELAAQWLAEMEAEGTIIEPEPKPIIGAEALHELDQAAMDALFDAEMKTAQADADATVIGTPEVAPPALVTGWRKLLPSWLGKADRRKADRRKADRRKADRRKAGAAKARKPGAKSPSRPSGRTAATGKPGMAARLKGPLGLGLVGILVLFGIITQRQSVVRLMPASASLFSAVNLPVNINGLEFIAVRSSTQTEGDARFLIVEGEVRSVQGDVVQVPLIELRLRGEDGRTIYTWTAEPPRKSLRPGEALHFRTRLATPPTAGRNVEVRFTDGLQSVKAGS